MSVGRVNSVSVRPSVCVCVCVFHVALSSVCLQHSPGTVAAVTVCKTCCSVPLLLVTPSLVFTTTHFLLSAPRGHGYCHVAWFCAFNVPSVGPVLPLFFAWQTPAQLVSPGKAGCLKHDSRTSNQAAFQTDPEDPALPSALGKKSANLNLTLNS